MFIYFLNLVLRIKPRTSYILGRDCTTEIQPPLFCISISVCLCLWAHAHNDPGQPQEPALPSHLVWKQGLLFCAVSSRLALGILFPPPISRPPGLQTFSLLCPAFTKALWIELRSLRLCIRHLTPWGDYSALRHCFIRVFLPFLCWTTGVQSLSSGTFCLFPCSCMSVTMHVLLIFFSTL